MDSTHLCTQRSLLYKGTITEINGCITSVFPSFYEKYKVQSVCTLNDKKANIGKVKKISIEDHHVRIDFFVNRQDGIREDSVAQIRQTNMLGGVFLGLDFGTPQSKLLPPGSEVQTEDPTNLDQLITNIDRDHLESYDNSFENLKKAFLEFLQHLPFYGAAILCVDDPEVASLIPQVNRAVVTFGLSENADIRATEVRQEGRNMSFRRPLRH